MKERLEIRKFGPIDHLVMVFYRMNILPISEPMANMPFCR